MIRAFEKPEYRDQMEQLARVLEREGLAAHRSADRLKKLSEFLYPVEPGVHTQDAIAAKLSSFYADASPVVTGFVARLSNVGLEDPDRLRQQAAILLDAAETVDRLLKWYMARVRALRARDLTNDTIIAIMLEWNLRPRETSRRLRAHQVVVSEGAIKQAMAKGRGQFVPGQEPTLLSFVPALLRREHST